MIYKTRVISICSQKGGTGKTTTTVNLASCLTELGKKILAIDIDPQANLTTSLGIDVSNVESTIYDVLLNPDQSVPFALRKTEIENLYLVPSSLDLVGAEFELTNMIGRELLLKRALKTCEDNYDYIFIDTPPSLGLFTQNALVACQEVIVPIQVHVLALKSLPQLQKIVTVVKKQNPNLSIRGVVCTMFDSRNNLSKVVLETIYDEMGTLVFKTIIPFNITLAEAPAYGKPINIYAPSSPGCKAYRKLAMEFIKNE